MILFLDRMVLPGSTLHILCPLSVEARQAIFLDCEFDEHSLVNLHIDHHVGDASVLVRACCLPHYLITLLY